MLNTQADNRAKSFWARLHHQYQNWGHHLCSVEGWARSLESLCLDTPQGLSWLASWLTVPSLPAFSREHGACWGSLSTRAPELAVLVSSSPILNARKAEKSKSKPSYLIRDSLGWSIVYKITAAFRSDLSLSLKRMVISLYKYSFGKWR